MNSPRIGCVKYLNARPLIRGWQGQVDFDHPSALCKRLAKGDLNVALVSSIELLRHPIYRVVDKVSISSDGPVYSVVVAHQDALSDIEEIELDAASETSANLLRCLLAEQGLNPRLIGNIDMQSVCPRGLQPAGSAVVDPAGRDAENIFAGRKGRMPVFQSPHGARLLIGDQAIRFRQKYAEEFHFWDLGEEWNRLVGLPFVYALWLIRPEVKDPNTIANRLRALRDDNLEHLAELVVTEKEFDSEFCRRYYCDHLRFKFGSSERKGLQSFASLCAKHGLLEKDKLQFTLV